MQMQMQPQQPNPPMTPAAIQSIQAVQAPMMIEDPMRGKNQFLQEKIDKLQEIHDQLKRDYQEQKNFYEEALEQRMKQLEEFEDETAKLKAERDGAKRSEIETKSKIEAMKFENELLKKRLESGSKDKTDANSREDGLLH